MYLVDSLRDTRSGDRIPVRERFFVPVQTGPGAHPASDIMGTGSFLRLKRPGRGVDHPHLAPRLKKEYSYISTPPLGLRALFKGELYLYLLPLHILSSTFMFIIYIFPGKTNPVTVGPAILRAKTMK